MKKVALAAVSFAAGYAFCFVVAREVYRDQNKKLVQVFGLAKENFLIVTKMAPHIDPRTLEVIINDVEFARITAGMEELNERDE